METHNHTHTHLCGCLNIGVCFTCCLSSLSFSPQLYYPFLFLFLSFLHFSQHVPHLPFLTLYFSHPSFSLQLHQAAAREEVSLGQPQTGNICSIFWLLARPFLRPCVHGRNNPTVYTTRSLHPLAVLFSSKERVQYFTVCPPHLVSLSVPPTF